MQWKRQGSAGVRPVVRVLGLLVAVTVTAWLVRWALDQGPAPDRNAAVVAPVTVPLTVAPTPVPLVVIGDSYTGGSDQGGYGSARWTAVAGRDLEAAKLPVLLSVNAVGGTGYVATNGTGKAFPDRIDASVVPEQTRIVVVFGSRNDAPQAGAVGAAAQRLYADIHRLAPRAQLMVIGPPWVDENVPVTIEQVRDTLKQATATARGIFVDPLAEKWFFGADSALIGSDGVHPINAGHAYMAQKILVHLKPLVAAQYKLLNSNPAATPAG